MEKFRTRIEQDTADGFDVLGDRIGRFYTGEKAANYGFPCDEKLPADDENVVRFTPPEDAVFVAKVYGYSHSGMRISLAPFGDKWDSAQIGFYVVEKQEAKFWYGDEYSDDEIRHKVESEIDSVDAVLRGDVHYVVLEKLVSCDVPGHAESWEMVDSLGGIIGYEHAEAEADALLRYQEARV